MRKRPLRVVLLVYSDLVPPADIKPADLENDQPWESEHHVKTALEDELGHEVLVLGVDESLSSIRTTIKEFKPHIVFNMLEEFAGQAIFDQHIVSYLELLNVPYTGCNPRGMMVARDKALSKKILAYHRIKVPRFFVVQRGRRTRMPKALRYPLMVKSLTEEASRAISQKSIVDSQDALRERVEFIHDSVGTHAIVEEFIAGREIYVGVLGNKRLTTLPPWELVMTKRRSGEPLLASRAAKWDRAYQKRKGLKTHAAHGFSTIEMQQVSVVCKKIYRLLYMSGYGRLDFRLDEQGELYLLEANPNANLAYGEDLAESAEFAGISYASLINSILNFGLSYDPLRYV